jgi:hypothetical protein
MLDFLHSGMTFKIHLCLCKEESQHALTFLHNAMMLFKIHFKFVEGGKVVCASFPPQWNDFV